MTVLATMTLGEQLSRNFIGERLLARLASLFGLLALLLASVGLYGVTAYSVVQRTGEIGVRVAFGASRAGIVAMVLRSAFLQVAIGIAIGVPATLGVGKLLSHRLFSVSGHDPVVLGGSALLLMTCAAIAAFVPARRAARLDPMQALRVE